MASNYYTPQIKYQSRDYTSLRDDMVGLIPNFAPQWTSRDNTDFGIVLIEMFSYMGDILNYYIDRAANEGFISTATQRDTVVNLARLLGYAPSEPTPAQVNLTITNPDATATSQIKTLAQFTTNTPDNNGNYIYFEYLGTDVSISASSTTSITVIEGQTVATSSVAVSDATPDQTFPVYNDQLIYPSYLTVVVGGQLDNNGVVQGGTTYTRASNLIDYGPSDTVYSTYYDGNNILHLRFGDGRSGKIPPLNSNIFVSYRRGLGSFGNVGANTVTQISSNNGGPDTSLLTFTNPDTDPAVSGSDPEPSDSIRINAPLSLRSLNRAVSLSDYASIAVQNSNIAKANAIADNLSSIVIYVMGSNWNVSLSSTVLDAVKNSYATAVPPGTLVSVLNGNVAYPAISVSIAALPTASNDAITSAAGSAIQNLLSFDNVTFNDIIYQSDIYKVLKGIDGVNDVTITGLERRITSTSTASTTPNASAYFYVNEVPKYDEQNITITVTGGV